MNAKTAYHKLSVMLGLAEEVEVNLTEATLVDGTVVKTDGDIAEGAMLMIVTPEGDMPAPAGMYETVEGTIITVDETGVIIAMEEKAAEEPAAEVEVEASEEFSLEDVADVIRPLIEKIDSLKAELESHKGEFAAFKAEPASENVKKTALKAVEETTAASRIEFLASLRKKK